jgi:TRAP-type C4-dicarboxylate transport system permease small subunit
MSDTVFVGLLGGAGATVAGLHQAEHGHVDVALAFAPVPVTNWAGQIAVIAVVAAFLIGFLFWSERTMSASFFRGVLAGTGFVFKWTSCWSPVRLSRSRLLVVCDDARAPQS